MATDPTQFVPNQGSGSGDAATELNTLRRQLVTGEVLVPTGGISWTTELGNPDQVIATLSDDGDFTPTGGLSVTSVTDPTATCEVTGGPADGATAVGVASDTNAAYSNASAKLHSFRNDGTEKAAVKYDGSYVTADGKIGVGTTSPGQAVHIANGNFLIDGASENSLIFKRSGTIGTEDDPIFALGRIVAGGVDKPEFRMLYSDVSESERPIFIIESTGTIAQVSDNVRRSQYEGYTADGTVDPNFRISSYPDQVLELGPGGQKCDIGGLVRATNVVTVTTADNHKFGVGETFTLDPGEANFAAGTYTVASTPTGTTFTYADTGTNGASTAVQYVSAATDVHLARSGYGTFNVKINGTTRAAVTSTGLSVTGSTTSTTDVVSSTDGNGFGLRGAASAQGMISSGNITAIRGTPVYLQSLSGGTQYAVFGTTGMTQFGTGISVLTGTGDPEGVVTAPQGSLFMRTDGSTSTTLYVKTSGAGNTGWTAK